jgi:NADH-quinone oxidoreductase subunit H
MTLLSCPILCDAAPSLVENLIFGGKPGMLFEVIYDLAIVAMVFLPAVSLIAMFCIWWERKVAGHMQCRFGPNRVGPIGLLQSLADGVKLLLKEDLVPEHADAFLFRLAPYLAFAPAFAAFLALPFAPNFIFEPRLNVGLFWILAILSVEVMGVILAGWASNNKWAVYGAMREACQMVSYEIPLGISILVGVMSAGTLNLARLSAMQGGGLHTWIIFKSPFAFAAFFAYFIASLASNKRAPFDLPESESELVAGFHTEYSGLRFSFFFFAEYAAMFIVGCIQASLFLGGWNDPFGILGKLFHSYGLAYAQDSSVANAIPLLILNVIGTVIFVTKALGIIFVQMWLRWTLPRPRIDQVLYACVKVLLPLSCVLLLGATLWGWLVPDRSGIPFEDYSPFSLAAWRDAPAGNALFELAVQVLLMLVGVAMLTSVVAWIGYAAATGRGLKQRLTDPADIPDPSAEPPAAPAPAAAAAPAH